MALGRRQFIGSAFIAAISAAAGEFPMARAMPTPKEPSGSGLQSGLPFRLKQRALAAFAQHDSMISQRRVMAIADFSAMSATPRFHILNVEDGQSSALLVAHGRGSDPDHSGWVQNFSNIPGSEATSSGAYLAGESYIGQHGLSRRLAGLDPENDQAEARAIVIHPAWYVSEAMALEKGKIGRSQGCFAFSDTDIGEVLWRLPPGSLIYANKI